MQFRVRASLVLALLVFAVPRLMAQATGTVEGTVTDAGSKRPLQGAQVSIVGTGGTVGAVTNAQGGFRILNVTAGSRQVRARLIGYAPTIKTVDVSAGGTATVAISIAQSAVELSAVVTTGTGGSQVEARKLGNTVASIEPPKNAPISSFSDMLQGREPGVMALPSSGVTGEGSRIRIRGNASLSQSNEPIVYVDGVRIDNGGSFGRGFVGTGGGGNPSRLDDVDPSTIEKVEVLKGAAAATLYGTEASNGVLLITTKKGNVGSPRWLFEAEQGMKNYPKGRIESEWGIAANSLTASAARRCALTSSTVPATFQACADAQAARLQQHYGTTVTAFTPFSRDVATQLFETGTATTLGAQVSGGTPLVTYFGSIRGYNEDGPFTAKNMDWKDSQGKTRGVFSKDLDNRYSGTLSVGLTPARAVKVQTTALYTQTHQEIPENNNSIYSPYTVALFSKPENAQCDASVNAGLNVATNGSMGNGYCAGQGNPTGASTFGSERELVQRTIKQDARHFNGHVRTSYIPTSTLNFDATFGIDYTHARSTAFLPFGNNVDLRTNQANQGDASVDDRAHQEITVSVNGGWVKDLPMQMNSNLIFGTQGFVTRENDESSNNKVFPGPGIEVVGGGSVPQIFEAFTSIVNAGYFAQEQLGFHDWLFVTGGGRYDYNSAFGKTSGGVMYPQGSISIIPSDRSGYRDSFMAKYLSTVRFRGAIGKAGRQPGAFDKLTTYTALSAGSGASGLVPQNLGNPNLKPEVSTEWEVGTEAGVMEDRISLGFTRWQRSTKDALYARQFPVTGGFRASQLDNIGLMEAWGWDTRVKGFLINSPSVQADMYGSIGFLSQIVRSLGGAPPSKVGGSYPRYRNFVKEGYAPGSFFAGKLPGACPGGTGIGTNSNYLAKAPTTPASKATGGICLKTGQYPFDTNGDGFPDDQATLLAFLAQPRLAANVDPMQADDDNNGDKLDHFSGKPLPDFDGSFGGSVSFMKNWRVSTNLEYRFGNYTISNLTSAFRTGNPTNGGNTKLRATVEGILENPASTAQQRLDAAVIYANQLKALSPYDGMNQQMKGDFLRWRELSLTYTAPQTWAAKAGATDMQFTLSARNFALWTKYPGVDPEVNVYSRNAAGTGGTNQNFGESIDAFGFPIPRQIALNIRMGF